MKELYDRHRQLSLLELDGEITAVEAEELSLVRRMLERIQDVEVGPSLDFWESFVEALESLGPEVDAMILREGDKWVVQWLEYNIAAQGDTKEEAVNNFVQAIVGQMLVNMLHGKGPFEDVPETPRFYWELVERGKVMVYRVMIELKCTGAPEPNGTENELKLRRVLDLYGDEVLAPEEMVSTMFRGMYDTFRRVELAQLSKDES